MELIPVIDLMGDVVVHAQRGERANYRPITSRLCEGADPATVARALRDLAPFHTLYVADLDAIAGHPPHTAAIEGLCGQFDDVWLDAGGAPVAQGGRLRRVLGTESMPDLETGRAVLDGGSAILSLDHGSEGPRGPRELHARAELWPDAVIVMTLASVGAGEGPDFSRLIETLARAGSRRVYAAGGVRGADDLHRLRDIGVAGVLLASALHDGRLAAAELAAIMG